MSSFKGEEKQLLEGFTLTTVSSVIDAFRDGLKVELQCGTHGLPLTTAHEKAFASSIPNGLVIAARIAPKPPTPAEIIGTININQLSLNGYRIVKTNGDLY